MADAGWPVATDSLAASRPRASISSWILAAQETHSPDGLTARPP